MRKFVDLSNTQNEYFNILDLAEKRLVKNKTFQYFYNCICKRCGSKTIVLNSYLKNNHTKSCGCSLRKRGKHHKDWKGYGEISSSRFGEIKRSAVIRDLSFNIDLKYLSELFEKQNKICDLSGLPIVMGDNIDRGNASLDRIDNTKGYVAGNVRWVIKEVNLMKNVLTEERFKELCKLITEYEQNISNTLQ